MHDGTPQSQVATLTPVEGLDPAASRLEDVLVHREEMRSRQWRARWKVWGPILATALGGGAYGANEFELLSPEIPAELQAEIHEVKTQSDANSEGLRNLGKVVIETADHLGNKIDNAHPEVIPEEKPESLKAAEEKLEEQKQETRLDKVLDTGGLGDK